MQLFHLALTLLVILVWGVNFIAIKVALEEISPILLCCIRFFLTSIPLIFFIKRPAAPFRKIVSYGLIMFALQFSLLFIAMRVGVTPGTASILLQTQVFFSLALGILFLKEKLRILQILGILCAFSGIALVGINMEGGGSLLGFFLMIAAAALWGVGNVISKKMGDVNMISLVVWGSLIAWPPLLALSLVLEGPSQILNTLQHLSWPSIGGISFITYFSTLFGYSSWSWLLHKYSMGAMAPWVLLVPVVGMLSSMLVLGEPLQSWKIIAALLVLTGLCINLYPGKRRIVV